MIRTLGKVLALVVLSIALFSEASWAQSIQYDTNVSEALKAEVNGDLLFLQSMQGFKQSPLHQTIFGALDGQIYSQWFVKRVQFFGVDSCGSAGTAVACTKSGYPNKIWVTNNYITLNYPQIARLMTLYHEARHTELENHHWPHAKCPMRYPYSSIWTGASLRGKSACDVTVLGSYGSASIMLNNISKFCVGCTDKVRTDAALYADDQSKRMITKDSYDQIVKDFQYE